MSTYYHNIRVRCANKLLIQLTSRADGIYMLPGVVELLTYEDIRYSVYVAIAVGAEGVADSGTGVLTWILVTLDALYNKTR